MNEGTRNFLSQTAALRNVDITVQTGPKVPADAGYLDRSMRVPASIRKAEELLRKEGLRQPDTTRGLKKPQSD